MCKLEHSFWPRRKLQNIQTTEALFSVLKVWLYQTLSWPILRVNSKQVPELRAKTYVPFLTSQIVGIHTRPKWNAMDNAQIMIMMMIIYYDEFKFENEKADEKSMTIILIGNVFFSCSLWFWMAPTRTRFQTICQYLSKHKINWVFLVWIDREK